MAEIFALDLDEDAEEDEQQPPQAQQQQRQRLRQSSSAAQPVSEDGGSPPGTGRSPGGGSYGLGRARGIEEEEEEEEEGEEGGQEEEGQEGGPIGAVTPAKVVVGFQPLLPAAPTSPARAVLPSGRRGRRDLNRSLSPQPRSSRPGGGGGGGEDAPSDEEEEEEEAGTQLLPARSLPTSMMHGRRHRGTGFAHPYKGKLAPGGQVRQTSPPKRSDSPSTRGGMSGQQGRGVQYSR